MIEWPVFYWEPNTLSAFSSEEALNRHLEEWILDYGVTFYDRCGRRLDAKKQRRSSKFWWWDCSYEVLVFDASSEFRGKDVNEFRMILLRWLLLFGGYQNANLERDSIEELVQKALQVPGVLVE